jgi:multiple sugar transport system substrate-binding protein
MDDFTTFIDYFKNGDGDVFGIPMEAFIKVYLYRKDLFEAADAKAAFRSQYGYGLAPATTFGQWRDNAEFFTGYCAEKGMQCWGTTVQGHTGHPASTYEFLESIAPSTTIASSNSFGIPSIIPFNNQIAKGKLKIQYKRINPIFVSNKE